jgi:hypothetical protein
LNLFDQWRFIVSYHPDTVPMGLRATACNDISGNRGNNPRLP